jgi:CRISPR-associated endonuclease/helicase Cas3
MHQLYPYQERLLEALLEGKNIILVIPTGGGKTFAATIPFFQSLAFGDGLLPEKALYVVPMRVLATQFLATCQELYEQLGPERLREIVARYQPFRADFISIQTGESPDDVLFEALVIACTIDQMLASSMGVPYGLSAKLGNINVGAICGAYLILDEPHQ